MAMAVTSLRKPHKLLHYQESNYPSQHPQPNHHVLHMVMNVHVVVMVIVVVMAIHVIMLMDVMILMHVITVVMVLIVGVSMRGYCMGYEMKKCIPQKATTCKTQEHFQKGGVLRGVFKGNKTEDEKRCSADEDCRHDCIQPQLPGALKRPCKMLQSFPTAVCMITMSRNKCQAEDQQYQGRKPADMKKSSKMASKLVTAL